MQSRATGSSSGSAALLPAEQPHRPDRPAHDPAQHVAAALVGRRDAVADEHQRGADVVGDHPQPHVVGVRLAGRRARSARRSVLPVSSAARARIGRDLVDLVEVVDALQQRRHPLQAHAGVDVLRRQLAEDREVLLVRARRRDLVLHEDEVPELQVPVLVDLRAALGAVGGAAVVVELRARAARARDAHRPEVVLLAAAHDALQRAARSLVPDLDRLVVVEVDRRPDLLRVEPEAALARPAW